MAGKVRYYGVWADPNAALDRFEKERNYHYRNLEAPPEKPQVRDLLNSFMDAKQQALDAGEISPVAFSEYQTTCDAIAAILGRSRPLEDVTHNDLVQLRAALKQGKTKELGIVTYKRRLTIARMVMKYAVKLGEIIDYADGLKAPPAKDLRKQRKASGIKLYEASELRKLVKAADPHLKAMVLLGINCAFGPKDCCSLPVGEVDLEGGWHNFARPKTEVDRRCPLWPETVAAIQVVKGTNKVFNGRPWNRHTVAREFEKLCKACEVTNHGFYSLRRTFVTIAQTADVNQAVVDCVTGHARGDMASIYRQKVFDSQLRNCTDHVRQWYLGKVKLR